RGLVNAAALIEGGQLESNVAERYAGWDGALGQSILTGTESLASLSEHAREGRADLTPVSGRQELLENVVSRYVR
ncbi:MAG: xylose isomerase, partial [Gammaproteobacteria bacterium]|nr:xylose isomerase [Gammaproteobacteria bacterium]